MKAKTKKLILTKQGKVNFIYSNAINNCTINDVANKIYPKQWGKNGASLKDQSHHIKKVLDAQGYKYKLGNDAPRGGKEGDFIKVSSVALNFLRSLKK